MTEMTEMTETTDAASGATPTRSRTMLIAIILLSVCLAAAAQIMLKQGMNHVAEVSGAFTPTSGASLRAAATTPLVWIGLFTFALSALVWLAVLSRVDLSFAYPFASLTYVIILLYSKYIGDEPVSLVRWGGAALIVTGIVLIAQDTGTASAASGG